MALKTTIVPISGTAVSNGVTASVTKDAERHDLLVSTSTNPGGNNAFQSEHKVVSGSILQTVEFGGTGIVWDKCPSAFYDLTSSYIGTSSATNADFDRVLANTNPANPNISVPVFWAELRDLPDMIRQGGRIAHAIKHRRDWRNLIRKRSGATDTAAAYLAVKFGWAPFISDMWRLATFQDSVDRRRAMFEKLQKKGLRGRVNLGSSYDSSGGTTTVWSTLGITVSTGFTRIRKYRKWGTVRWTPRVDMPLPRSDGELRRRMTGFTADNVPIQVWEALPWTWLTDYFVNIGDQLKAANRTVAIPSHACVMVERTLTYAHPEKTITTASRHSLSPGTLEWTHRARNPKAGVLPITSAFPTLSGGQLSILGALAVTRARKGTF